VTFVPALYQRVMTSDGWSVRQVRNMIGGPELGQEQEPERACGEAGAEEDWGRERWR